MVGQQDESKRILNRVQSEAETIGNSSMLKAADKAVQARGHEEDPDMKAIDELGTKIGRTLGRIAFVALAAYLLFTYVLPIR